MGTPIRYKALTAAEPFVAAGTRLTENHGIFPTKWVQRASNNQITRLFCLGALNVVD